MNNDEKELFLTKIREHKDVIFGKFSDLITREKKLEMWKAIVDVLKHHNVQLASEKEVGYFRDSVWPNMKRYTLEKRDRKRRTGEGGGTATKFTRVDELVLDIIGENSPQVSGLNINETWMKENIEPSTSTDMHWNSTTTDEACAPPATLSNSTPKPSKRNRLDDFTEQYRAKKMQKIDLDIENLQLRNALLRQQLRNKNQEKEAVIEEDGYFYRRLT